MKHSPSASLGKGQSHGPSPQLFSRQSTPLPELGPRPRSSLSWLLPWGCSAGKVPIGGPFCDPSSRMGAVPHSGATAVSRLDSSAPELSPPISHYGHRYSHYNHCSHTHHSQTPLSHTTLTHHSHTHRSHTMTISTAVSRRNGTRLCLQHVSQGPEPETHSVTRGSMVTGGLGSGPSSGVHRGGRGCQKDVRGVWCVGEGKPCPQLRPTVKHNPARILVHSRTK